MNEMFKYGNLCDKYDMSGNVKIKNGILRVHDIFNPIPDFMKQADVIFSDPPCSKANINSFYAKAEKEERQDSYAPFHKRFWEVIDEIAPRVLFLEVFKSNKDAFTAECIARYKHIKIFDSMYYKNPKNKCWIIQASNEPLENLELQGIDEEDAIKKICAESNYECIGDPCMGKGLIAFYASKAGRKFVGTELNKYRLAVACERVSTGERGKIN